MSKHKTSDIDTTYNIPLLRQKNLLIHFFHFSKEEKNEQRIFLFFPPHFFEHELQQKIIPIMFFLKTCRTCLSLAPLLFKRSLMDSLVLVPETAPEAS